MEPGRPPEEGARLIALGFLDQAAAVFPGLQDGSSEEALHDFRVALRRLRSCLRAYRPWLEESLPKKLRRRLEDLAAVTGPGRDTEVQIEWLRGQSRALSSRQRPGLAWLLIRLGDRLRDARAEMTESIAREFPAFEDDLRRRLSTYRTEVHLDAEAPPPALMEVTADLLRHQAKDLVDMLGRVEGPGDQDEAHRARIRAKRVRYLLEPFAEDSPQAASIVRSVRGLQDILGELHDAHVLEAELAGAVEVAAAERARKLLDLSLADPIDEARLRSERRKPLEPGLLMLAKLNRARRDRLFGELKAGWLDGRSVGLFTDVESLATSNTPG